MNRLTEFSAVLCLLGCTGDLSATSCESFTVERVEQGESVSFCIRLKNGTEVDNIVVMRDRIDRVLVLQYRGHNGLELRESMARDDKQGHTRSLSADEFAELLDSTLKQVGKKIGGEAIRRIQFDAILVRDTWQQIIAAVSDVAADLDGQIRPKVEDVDDAARQTILQSKQLEQTCTILREHGLACMSHISFNPVVFEPGVLGKSWRDLRSFENRGISESTWFGVTVQQHQED